MEDLWINDGVSNLRFQYFRVLRIIRRISYMRSPFPLGI